VRRLIPLVAILAAWPALGQVASDGAVLRGPSVPSARPVTTLVERDYDGHVRRLTDEAPEQRALALLSLEPEARERVSRIVAERTRLLDDLVADNLDLLGQLDSAGKAHDATGLLAIAGEFWRRSEALRARGRMQDEIGAALPAGPRAAYHALVDGYWRAVVEDRRLANRKEPRLGLLIDEKLKALGEQVRASFERQLADGNIGIRYLLSITGLRPEQESQIRGFVADFVEEHGPGAPASEKDLQMLFVRVLVHLNQEQRETVLRRLIPQRGEKIGHRGTGAQRKAGEKEGASESRGR
jgi:hypothetical protein